MISMRYADLAAIILMSAGIGWTAARRTAIVDRIIASRLGRRLGLVRAVVLSPMPGVVQRPSSRGTHPSAFPAAGGRTAAPRSPGTSNPTKVVPRRSVREHRRHG